MKTSTSKERIEAIIRKSPIDSKVPFTIYETLLPKCETERILRNEGLCIVDRNISGYKTITKDVEVEEVVKLKEGKRKTYTFYKTPVGTASSVVVGPIALPVGTTNWSEKYIFSDVKDYEPLEFIIENTFYEPDYEPIIKAVEWSGSDIIYRGHFGGNDPLTQIVHGYMGLTCFCYEWIDNRDKVLRLYNALVNQRRRMYEIAADAPFMHYNYGGNITPDFASVDIFKKYIAPVQNEAAEIVHSKGKFIGVHYDGNNKLLAKEIAATNIDYIEAFTPSPDSDMTLVEGLKAWIDKIIWMNFPSSVHLKPYEEVRTVMKSLLKENANSGRFIVGITENMPENWQNSCLAISSALNE